MMFQAIALAAISGCAAFAPVAAAAQELTTLYVYQDALDGGNPSAPVLFVKGELYGTTWYGGADGSGTVFQHNLKSGVESVVHSFNSNLDGSTPMGGLVEQNGYLYGTTAFGAGSNAGAAFKIDIKTGKEDTLHTFTGAPDGANPYAGLVFVGGNLYGTTDRGGATNSGTLFSINPRTGEEAVIYSFSGDADGTNPDTGVIKVGGSLYGTTGRGGSAGVGTIFRFNIADRRESTIYSFSGGADGGNPNGLFYYRGFLYGTTSGGGAGIGSGTVFKLDLSTGVKTIIYSFTGGSDGGTPFAGVILDGNTLYGTTHNGGISGCGGYGCGTVFEVDATTGIEKVLFSFDADSNGSEPYASLIEQSGVLYGTTFYGGSAPNLGHGTVFKLKP